MSREQAQKLLQDADVQSFTASLMTLQAFVKMQGGLAIDQETADLQTSAVAGLIHAAEKYTNVKLSTLIANKETANANVEKYVNAVVGLVIAAKADHMKAHCMNIAFGLQKADAERMEAIVGNVNPPSNLQLLSRWYSESQDEQVKRIISQWMRVVTGERAAINEEEHEAMMLRLNTYKANVAQQAKPINNLYKNVAL